MSLGLKSKIVVQNGIDNLEDFSLDTLIGRKVKRGDKISLGRLPKKQARGIDKACYIVFSYGTPIAWALDKDTWIIPRIDYSATTTQHQGIVRVAVDNTGFYS